MQGHIGNFLYLHFKFDPIRSKLNMKCLLFSLLLPFLFSCCLQVSESCDPCQGNQLSSNGGFGKFYPRFLGNWAYMRDFDGNPEFYCTNCGGLRAYTLFLRSSDGSDEGHWAITDCHPGDAACGGGFHKLLKSPLTTSATCLHEIPSDGWLYCSGELISNGICTEYDYDNTVNWTCN